MDDILLEEETATPSPQEDSEIIPEKKNDGKKAPVIQRLFSVQNRKKTIIILAVIMAVAIVAGCLLARTSPKSVAIRYAEAMLFSDYVKIHKTTAYDYYAFTLGEKSEEEYFENVSDKYKEDIESWKDMSTYFRSRSVEDLEDDYGNYKLSFDASRVKDMSLRRLEDEHEDLLDYLEEEVAFDRDDISAAKEVTVKIKLEGEDATERETWTICMVKINGAWKALYYESSD